MAPEIVGRELAVRTVGGDRVGRALERRSVAAGAGGLHDDARVRPQLDRGHLVRQAREGPVLRAQCEEAARARRAAEQPPGLMREPLAGAAEGEALAQG